MLGNMDYSLIVVGGGHAGLEAAFASAHMGEKTLLISLNFKKVGNMPCNPSIGGSAKGIVVREIDALGGMMGKIADIDYLQMKMLNTGKGPGVQCLRAQQDKTGYPENFQKEILNTPNLTYTDGEVVNLIHDDNHVYGVILRDGRRFTAKAVILTTGTYMNSTIHRGHEVLHEGPDNEKSSIGLSDKLKEMGINIYRLKTGTPPRIAKESIDFTNASIQPGTEGKYAFSYETDTFIPLEEQELCYLIYTTSETHEIIRKHLDDSALYSGQIVGAGPRYCPSIEAKIVNFADKERHQLFLEPESRNSNSIYVQGFSTSMPVEVQDLMIRSLPGFENAVVLKYGYAIEYDAIHCEEYGPTLEIKKWPGLYIGGQICGTSGYEEAAALGLVAAINAVFKIRGKDPFILARDEAYIGVMIDDLITKGTNEPYRLMSSRAEYRLLLRHDNADIRLSEIGYQIGLLPEKRYLAFKEKQASIQKAYDILNKVYLGKRKEIEEYAISKGFNELKGGILASEFLKRPGVKYLEIVNFIEELQNISLSVTAIEQLEVMVKYEGYIQKQLKDAARSKKLESLKIPKDIDYLNMNGLALEAREKLNIIRPLTVGQASRVSGVNPADISILILNIKKGNR